MSGYHCGLSLSKKILGHILPLRAVDASVAPYELDGVRIELEHILFKLLHTHLGLRVAVKWGDLLLSVCELLLPARLMGCAQLARDKLPHLISKL